MPRYFKTPHIVRWIFPRRVWSLSSTNNAVYLTFDDGPNRGLTDWILDFLDRRNIKATFFCVGSNAREYPELLQRIHGSGHSIGNHTMNHEKNSEVEPDEYFQSIEEASKYVPSKLFRPPYGRLSMSDAIRIRKKYKIIMWSWLSYDFDEDISNEEILSNANEQIKPGDILVLHDNTKTSDRLKILLPQLVDLIEKKGFEFKVISA